MPTYEYRCEANGRMVEVSHRLSERMQNWGELCARAGIAPGRTDPAAPVEKLISASFIGSGAGMSDPPCASGACDLPACGAGACGGGGCAGDGW
ncbi:MAG: hypothetical protein U1F35_04045 [Steroidobacteraceae bacterium]